MNFDRSPPRVPPDAQQDIAPYLCPGIGRELFLPKPCGFLNSQEEEMREIGGSMRLHVRPKKEASPGVEAGGRGIPFDGGREQIGISVCPLCAGPFGTLVTLEIA